MADRCWRCGVATAEHTRFCAQCGAQVRLPDAEIELLDDLPEHAEPALVEPAAEHGRRRILLIGVAVMAVLVGFFVLTDNETDPTTDDAFGVDPALDPAPTDGRAAGSAATTDTTPRRFGTIEGPLAWRPVITDVVGFPVAVTSVDGRTFIHVTDPPQGFGSGSTGARTFELLDGEWVDHGPMFDDGDRLAAVIEGTDGFLATGIRADGTPMLWRSDDATTWAGEPLPQSTVLPDTGAEPRLLAEADGTVVAAGAPVDPWVVVARDLADRYGERRWPARPDLSTGTGAVLVRGPFGLVLETLDPEAVGLDGPVIDSFVDVPPTSTSWITGDLATAVELVDGQVIDLEATPDGEILRSVGTPDGVLHDRFVGQGWLPVPTDAEVWDVEPAADGYVGVIRGNQIVSLSDELDVIEQIVAPGVGRNTFINTLVTGDRGFAVATAEWIDDPAVEEEPPSRIVVLRDGYTLSVNDRRGLDLRRAEETIVSLSDRPPADAATHRIEWVDGEPLVTFLDPVTGVDLVGFTFEELAEVEAASTTVRVRPRQVVSVLYTDDRGGWYGGELPRPGPTGNVFTRLHLDEDRILALIVGNADPIWRSSTGAALTFDVLEAPLP